MTRLSNLNQLALRARNIENRLKLTVASGFFVVACDAVTHEFAEYKDWGLNIESKRVVLKRGSVAIAHQVVDQTFVALIRLGIGL